MLKHVSAIQALKHLPREQVQLATKFGIVSMWPTTVVKGTPEYVRQCCEANLGRLGVDYIDLYYQHRVDTSVPIEQTVRLPVMIVYGLRMSWCEFVDLLFFVCIDWGT